MLLVMFIDNTEETTVLFQINVVNGGNRTLYPFADISRLSAKGPDGEEEVLFFPGAVFRIDSVKHESHSMSIIKLTLIDENIEIVEQLNTVLNRSFIFSQKYIGLLEKTDDYSLFNRYHMYLTGEKFSVGDIAKLLTYINVNRLVENSDDHQKAINYYEELLLVKNFIDPNKNIIFLILIGLNYFRLKRFDYAVDSYTDALELIDDGNRLAGEVYKYLGDVWRATNDLQTALLFYEKAVQNIANHPDKNKYIGEIYRKLVEIHFEQKNYEMANIYNDQADEVDEYLREKKPKFIDDETFLKYQQQLNIELDSNMLQYAHTLYSNGMLLIRRGHFKQGLKELLEAEPLFKEYLPVYDLIVHKLAKLYEHVTFAHFCLDDYFDALVAWKKAIDIRLSFNC